MLRIRVFPVTACLYSASCLAAVGPIESVRVMRQSRNGYVNFCSIESAVKARDAFNGVRASALFPTLNTPIEQDKEIQITFTTAQQNCRRNLNRDGRGGRGDHGGRGGGRGDTGSGRSGFIDFKQLQPSRSIYIGNLPHGTEVRMLSELSNPYVAREARILSIGAMPPRLRPWCRCRCRCRLCSI